MKSYYSTIFVFATAIENAAAMVASAAYVWERHMPFTLDSNGVHVLAIVDGVGTVSLLIAWGSGFVSQLSRWLISRRLDDLTLPRKRWANVSLFLTFLATWLLIMTPKVGGRAGISENMLKNKV